MNNIIAFIISVALFLYLLITAAMNGYMDSYLKFNILLAYFIIFAALCIITFGINGTLKTISSVRYLIQKQPPQDLSILAYIKKSIHYSYAASITWILGYISNGFIFENNSLSTEAISDISVAMSYGFIVSELLLRPIYNKVELTHNIS